MLLDPVRMEYLLPLERQNKLREAEQDRLVRLALMARGRRESFPLCVRTWIGHRLILWGQSLENRARVLPAANHCQPC